MKKQLNGFTVIELLVVIAVIGMLVSIVLVSLKGTREKASLAKSEQFSSSIGHVLGAYAVGIWDFNGNANDSSGYGNNGTVNGAILVADRKGQSNKAYSFDGVDDYVQVKNSPSLNLPDNFTIEAWFKTTHNCLTGTQCPLLYKRDAADIINYGLVMDSSERMTFQIRKDPNSATALIPRTISDGKWHHVVGVRDTSVHAVRIYLDGALAGSTADTTGDITNNAVVLIAAGWAQFGGTIDGIRIYAQAITTAKVRQLYAENAFRYQVVENVIK